MLGYTLKHVLELLPEVTPLVKSASLTEEYPISDRTNCLASALALNYKREFTSDGVDLDHIEKVAEAVSLYDIEEDVKRLTSTMKSRSKSAFLKQASEKESNDYMTKQANWEAGLCGWVDVQGLCKQAEVLFLQAMAEGITPSSKVCLYSGNAYLVKQAALDSLGVRFQVTEKDVFVKLASAMSSEPDLITSDRTVKNMLSTMNRLDAELGLDKKGFDFCKEAMIEKSAGKNVLVKIAGKDYPLDRVMRIPGTYMDSYLGSGFSKELQSDPNAAKYVVESLPADSQHILANLIRNV